MESINITKLDQQIADIESSLTSLYKKRVALLEGAIAHSKSRLDNIKAEAVAPKAATVKPVKAPVTAKPKASKPKGKRARMSSDEVIKRITTAVENAGAVGISQVAISKDSGVNYQTVVKKLKEGLNGVQKSGKGRNTRFSMK